MRCPRMPSCRHYESFEDFGPCMHYYAPDCNYQEIRVGVTLT